jgi:amidase
LTFARTNGIDAALKKDNLDAIVAPSYSFASSLPAVAGYPNISIPVGLTPQGKPAGLWMYSGFLQEPTLLAFAYDLEQAIKPRTQPGFLGSCRQSRQTLASAPRLRQRPGLRRRN